MNQQNYTEKHSNIFDTIDRLINMHVVRLGFKNCYIHRMKNKNKNKKKISLGDLFEVGLDKDKVS